MKVEILSPDQQIFSGDADYVQLPGKSGSFGVKANHAPLISSLQKGVVRVHSSSDEKEFNINGGVAEVFRNKVIVLAD